MRKKNSIEKVLTSKKVLRKKAISKAGTDEDRKKFHSFLKAISELKKLKKKTPSENYNHTKKKCFTNTLGIFLSKLSRNHYFRRN